MTQILSRTPTRRTRHPALCIELITARSNSRSPLPNLVTSKPILYLALFNSSRSAPASLATAHLLSIFLLFLLARGLVIDAHYLITTWTTRQNRRNGGRRVRIAI